MPALPWTDGLALGVPVMDTTHQEFIALLACAEAAGDDALPGVWEELVAHTADHFRREDDWMLATGFALGNCHSSHHAVVLQVLRDALAQATSGNLAPARQALGQLAVWFPQHAQTMDAALALHLQGLGFDPETGEMADGAALPAAAITGCGGGSCA
jgi:hemerythrin-like metal-binding protein